MTDYTPTTEEVIRGFSAPTHRLAPQQESESFGEYLSRMSVQTMEHQIASESAIRRWLAEHDREVAAAAWWAGAQAQWAHRPVGNRIPPTENPHREGRTDA